MQTKHLGQTQPNTLTSTLTDMDVLAQGKSMALSCWEKFFGMEAADSRERVWESIPMNKFQVIWGSRRPQLQASGLKRRSSPVTKPQQRFEKRRGVTERVE